MHKRLIALGFFATLASGCGLLYKVDVHQGNLLEESAVAQLEPGLSKRQVVVLVGTPSVRDPFHQSRWDYLASVKRDGGETEVRNLVLHFEGDRLARIEGDYFPEQDEELVREMGKYGNLPRDRNRDRGG